jgi:hypothetical protein
MLLITVVGKCTSSQDALPSWKSFRATRTFHIVKKGNTERIERKGPIFGK